nr:790_t:CDS:2 [Entrophospora candida]
MRDVLTVSFLPDNRQIVSGSRDKLIKLWNTLGECKFNIQDEGYTNWVFCVRFSPNSSNPVIVSSGWDKLVRKLNIFQRKSLTRSELKTNHHGHTGYINTVTIPPDGSLYASGGKDPNDERYNERGKWDVVWFTLRGPSLELFRIIRGNAWKNKKPTRDVLSLLNEIEEDEDRIYLVLKKKILQPSVYWPLILHIVKNMTIPIWDLETKKVIDDLKPDFTETGRHSKDPECISLAWSPDGTILFAGYTGWASGNEATDETIKKTQ